MRIALMAIGLPFVFAMATPENLNTVYGKNNIISDEEALSQLSAEFKKTTDIKPTEFAMQWQGRRQSTNVEYTCDFCHSKLTPR